MWCVIEFKMLVYFQIVCHLFANRSETFPTQSIIEITKANVCVWFTFLYVALARIKCVGMPFGASAQTKMKISRKQNTFLFKSSSEKRRTTTTKINTKELIYLCQTFCIWKLNRECARLHVHLIRRNSHTHIRCLLVVGAATTATHHSTARLLLSLHISKTIKHM